MKSTTIQLPVMLSNYIAVQEFLHSNTAIRKGINNTFATLNELQNAENLCKAILDPVREKFKAKINISSGYRSPELNRAIGSNTNSQHCKGEAVDIDDFSENFLSLKETFYFIRENLEFDQLIWEFGNNENPAWVHVSYKKIGNRKQVLKSKKLDGHTVYEPFK